MAPPLPPAPLGAKLTSAASPRVVVEMFHDLKCPFSKKMFETIYKEVWPELQTSATDAAAVEFLFQSVPQPWHPQSCNMHEASLAVLELDASKFYPFCAKVYETFEEFSDLNTMGMSRMELYAKLAGLGDAVGVPKDAMMEKLTPPADGGTAAVVQRMKWAVKYHRVRSVHVTPTVFINGTEAPDVGSGWTKEQWLEKLRPMLPSAL
eukprot:CAMPEP_0117556758 /NCGR_PEP_ID=MMETSP0784-20121206/51974_1 /TAXON_ID=39447 /ORGANISM="" /LENGTH=206 /DNA_ID=CAMNT_0005354043 /DNA_START=21 /DNA_END=641 /DNA_ORIENTATION=+